jgi:long-chain acyl-CoA synthetase
MSSSALPSNLRQLSVEVPNYTPRPGEGIPRRHALVADSQFITSYSAEVRSLYDSFMRSCSNFGSNNYLGYRAKDENGNVGPYQWISYYQVKERVDNFASGLVNKLHLPERSNIGIYSYNRVEWVFIIFF